MDEHQFKEKPVPKTLQVPVEDSDFLLRQSRQNVLRGILAAKSA